MSKSVEQEIEVAHNEIARAYLGAAIELVRKTGQKEMTFLRKTVETPEGGTHLLQFVHVSGPKIALQPIEGSELEEKVRREALHLQMRSGYRYIECLNCVASSYDRKLEDEDDVPDSWFEFYERFCDDWLDYLSRMRDAKQKTYRLSKVEPEDLRPLADLLRDRGRSEE